MQAQQEKKQLEEKLLAVKKQTDETDSNPLMKARSTKKCHNLFSLFISSKRFVVTSVHAL